MPPLGDSLRGSGGRRGGGGQFIGAVVKPAMPSGRNLGGFAIDHGANGASVVALENPFAFSTFSGLAFRGGLAFIELASGGGLTFIELASGGGLTLRGGLVCGSRALASLVVAIAELIGGYIFPHRSYATACLVNLSRYL